MTYGQDMDLIFFAHVSKAKHTTYAREREERDEKEYQHTLTHISKPIQACCNYTYPHMDKLWRVPDKFPHLSTFQHFSFLFHSPFSPVRELQRLWKGCVRNAIFSTSMQWQCWQCWQTVSQREKSRAVGKLNCFCQTHHRSSSSSLVFRP